MNKVFFFTIAILHVFFGFSQNNVSIVNQDSFNNYNHSYNYTYWNHNWKSPSSKYQSFTNQTSSYALNINYNKLSINSLLINNNNTPSTKSFSLLDSDIFPDQYKGNIDYAILQNGIPLYHKSTTPTNRKVRDSQLAEFGVWCNRRFISVNFNKQPPISKYYTGIEFTNWHNRFKITFHVRPKQDFKKGQLQLSFKMPLEYHEYYNSGQLHAFGLNNKGFVLKGGILAKDVKVEGSKITVTTAQKDLIANKSYQISILCYAIKDSLDTKYSNAFKDEPKIAIKAIQTAPETKTIKTISFDTNEGVHYIDTPRYNMGAKDYNTVNKLQNIQLKLSNSSSILKRVRLCFRQTPGINITGFNSMICNNNGSPSGLPLQVSKNWHNTVPQLYSNSWIKEYTEIIVPAHTTLNLVYKRTGAKWGETYAVSSHQLSVVGSGVPRGGWLQAALGSFGETITHSPDYEFGHTIGADLRPFLVTNTAYGKNSTKYNWTGNVGGIDLLVYVDSTGSRNYHSQVKTKFKAYSPNLTETSISSVSEDQNLKFDYTFYLNRSDDFTRVYYKIKVEALKNTTFNRFDIFQLGGDVYNIHTAKNIVYGNDTGKIGAFTPTNNGSNHYTTHEIALKGNNPWIWAGDGLYYHGAKNFPKNDINIDTNNGMIIRNYTASFAGVKNNTPYVMERSSSKGYASKMKTNPTSYCLVTPPEITSFTAGDTIELLVEVVVLPKQEKDYYGPNRNFKKALKTYGNTYKLLYRESLGNKAVASSVTNSVNNTYPITVKTLNNTAKVTLTGGKGYVPIVFSGLSSVTNPVLWKYDQNRWKIVDQSVHGKDFWQVNYNNKTQLFDIVYNVNQDVKNDENAEFIYYLGNKPPKN